MYNVATIVDSYAQTWSTVWKTWLQLEKTCTHLRDLKQSMNYFLFFKYSNYKFLDT